ncbi:T9SS type A sorting domain-containing protein [bacterium]|nr:T9SS type A sorting domain-containing protein [bacterium]
MRNIILLFIVALFATAAKAQPDSLWSRTYGGTEDDNCKTMIQTTDDCFVLAGWTESFGAGGYDMWMVKTNNDGDSLWSRTFGGEDNDRCYSIIQTTDGGYALAGYSYSFGVGESDIWLVKTDSEGNSLWSRTFGGDSTDCCYSIIQTEDEGYILAGHTKSFGSGEFDMWLIKTDVDGDSIWSRTFGGDSTDYCYSMIQTQDEGFALAGHTRSFGAGREDMLLIKTDTDGNSVWLKTYGGIYVDWCFSVVQSTDGSFLLGGSIIERRQDIMVVKSDADGDSLWARVFEIPYNEACLSMIHTTDEGYAIAGACTGSGGILLRIDAEGDSLWSMTFAGERRDEFYSIIQTATGGFVLAGYTWSFGAGEGDFWLVKTGPDPVSVPSQYHNLQPTNFILQPAFPNPFNSTTNIRFDLPYKSDVSINICDLSGRSVAILFNNRLNAGRHNLTWDAGQYPAGMYLCTMQAGEFSVTEKLLLVK